ncbi:MAG: flavoprotein [Terriglobales bacterium]
MRSTKKVLYIVTSATLAATRIDILVQQAVAKDWDVWVVSTPQGMNFIDKPKLEQLTGHPVRSQYRRYDQPKQAPLADAVVFAAASFNSINKWALGLADNLALSTLCELTGTATPKVLLPFLSDVMARHPAFDTSIQALKAAGIHVLLGPDTYEPHTANTGQDVLATYPWNSVLNTLTQIGATSPETLD